MANMFAEYAKKNTGAGQAPASGGNGDLHQFYDQLMENAGAKQGIPAGMMARVRSKETGGEADPARAVSPKGAYGLGQVLPSTARDMGYTDEQMQDPAIQAEASARYLRQMYDRYGDWGTALQAYHDGPGNTDKMLKGEYTPGPEGQQYVDERFDQFTGGGSPITNQEVPQQATAARRVSEGNLFAEYARGGSTQPAGTGSAQPTGPQADPLPQAATGATTPQTVDDQANAWAQVMPGFVQSKGPATAPAPQWNQQGTPQNAPAGQQPLLQGPATQPQSQQQQTPQEPDQGLFDTIGSYAAKGGRAVINAGVDIARPVWNWAASQAESQVPQLPGQPRTVLPRISKDQDEVISGLERVLGAQPGSLHTQGVGEEVAAAILPYFVGPGELKALEKVPGAARFVVNSLLRNAVGSTTEAAKHDESLSEFVKNEGIGVAVDTAFKGLGKVLKPVWNATKAGLGFGTKTASATERQIGENAVKAQEGTGRAVELEAAPSPTTPPGTTVQTTDAMQTVASKIDPDEKVLAAARRLGMEDQLAPSHYTRNRQTREVLGALQSVTGSELSAANAKAIETLAEKADDLINIAGGTKDKVAFSEKFKNEARKTIDDLGIRADNLYNVVRERIPDGADVEAKNTVDYLINRADKMRGSQNLHPTERKVLDALNPKGEKLPDGTYAAAPPPSYALLDQMRRDVGEALYKNTGPFQNAGEGRLKQLYAKLTADQEVAATQYGADDLWNAGKKLVAQRKELEDRYLAVVGKNEAEQAGVKYGRAIQSLQTGDTKAWDQLIANTPPKLRQEAVASALAEVFTKRSQKEGSLHIPGFVDWYNGAKQSGALPKVLQHLDKESRQRFVNIANVANGIRRGNEFNLSTGKLNGFIDRFNSGQSPLTRLFGLSLQGASYGTGLAAGGPLGGLIAHGVNKAASGAKTALERSQAARVDAADELLTSPQFLDVVKAAAYRSTQEARLVEKVRTGTATPAEVKQLAKYEGPIKTAERKLNGIPAWQRLRATMTAQERADLKRYGAAGWLAGFGKSQAASSSDEDQE